MKLFTKIGAALFCGLLVAGFAMAHDTSPARDVVIPEAVWAPATGGGTWVTEIQITSFTADTTIQVWFVTTDTMRGPITLTTLGQYRSVLYTNILSALNSLEGGAYAYSGKSGALWFKTQSTAHRIHVQARTRNGNFGKTFQGQAVYNPTDSSIVASYVARVSPIQRGVIQNLINNATYRSFVGFANISGSPISIQFTVIASPGGFAGTPFTKTIPGGRFVVFNPFEEAGVPYPGNSFTNCWLFVNPTSGDGRVMGFGSSTNNTTNDSFAHVMVQFSH